MNVRKRNDSSSSLSPEPWVYVFLAKYGLQSQPSILPSISVFSNESVLHIRWPKYWSFSFNRSPSNEYSGPISFRTEWFDLLAVQGTLKSLPQHHRSKASILRYSAFLGEGNGNPLQCSCLENPRDGGAWWAVVSGVTQSRTRLKRLSSSSSRITVRSSQVSFNPLTKKYLLLKRKCLITICSVLHHLATS